jgi:hypothetical protein
VSLSHAPAAVMSLLGTEQPVGNGALTVRAHVFVVVVTLASVVFIVRLVRRHKLRTKYSLLWIVVALALATVAVFPGLLERVSSAAGVYYPPATFLILAVGFLFLIVVHFSWEFSRSEERIRTLAEDLALLRASHEALADELRARGAADDADTTVARSAEPEN